MSLFGGKSGLTGVAILNLGETFLEKLRGVSLGDYRCTCFQIGLCSLKLLGHWRLDTGFDMGSLLTWGFELGTSRMWGGCRSPLQWVLIRWLRKRSRFDFLPQKRKDRVVKLTSELLFWKTSRFCSSLPLTIEWMSEGCGSLGSGSEIRSSILVRHVKWWSLG